MTRRYTYQKKHFKSFYRRFSICGIVVVLLMLLVPASADQYVGGMPLENVQTGIVSGDLYIDATVPSFGQTDVTKKFSLPAYTQIRWARLYVVVYCGHMQNNYNGTATVSLDGNGDGVNEVVLGTEDLDVPFTYVADGGTGYVLVNGHTTRVSSDYLMWYDVGNRITSRNPGVRVETSRINPSFDGRIKAVTLVVAYDDGDSDQVWFAVNQGHDVDTYYSDDWLGEDFWGETYFDPSGLSESIEKATLTVNHLASQDGSYLFNGDYLAGGQYQGAYFGYNTWDVTDLVDPDGSNDLFFDRADQFYKIILATLTIRQGVEPEETPEDEEYPDEDGSAYTDSGGQDSDVPIDENGYYGQIIPATITGKVNGSVDVSETSDYSGLLLPGDSKEYTLEIGDIPGDGVSLARMYAYTTWDHDERRREGLMAPLELEYGGTILSPKAHYTDRKGFGIYDYPAESFAYDIRELAGGEKNLTFTVMNTGEGHEAFAVYGMLAVIAYETSGGAPTMYWIAEGSDVVLADPAFETTSEGATTIFSFEEVPGTVSEGKLYLISTASSGEPGAENRVTFNGADWDNILKGGSSAISLVSLDVSELIESGRNEANIQSYLTMKPGDYLENRGAVLVVATGERKDISPAGTPGELTPRESVAMTTLHTPAPEQPTTGDGTSGGLLDWLYRLLFSPMLPATTPDEKVQAESSYLSHEVNLKIITEPEGARVALNGMEVEDLTPLAVAVSRNEPQKVTLTLDGYDPYDAFITPGSDYDLHVIFTPHAPENPPGYDARSSDDSLGGVYIESYPSDASVFIDGRESGHNTPYLVYGLREGYHTVEVEKTNTIFPAARRVYVAAGTITPVLFTEGVAYTRKLNIASNDFAGCSFTVNGRGTPQEIPCEADIDGSPAYLVIQNDGSYLSRNVPSGLESGDTLVIRSAPEDGEHLSVVVTSDPPGSEVFFDGFSTGQKTPAVVTDVSPGLHRVSVQAAGYIPGEKEVLVTDSVGDLVDERVFIWLEPYPHGSLNLTSDPDRARVYISGRYTGERTPVTIPYLPIGMYIVKLVGEEESRSYEVVVTPGEEKNIHAVFSG
jgi:hypothetical protein